MLWYRRAPGLPVPCSMTLALLEYHSCMQISLAHAQMLLGRKPPKQPIPGSVPRFSGAPLTDACMMLCRTVLNLPLPCSMLQQLVRMSCCMLQACQS